MTSRAATDIFNSESVQMKTYLQIGGPRKGSVPFFLNVLSCLGYEALSMNLDREGRRI